MMIRVLILLLFVSATVRGQDPTPALDALLNEGFKSNEPGAVALVAKGGKVIYRKAFGMANLELQVPMKPEHIFEIGSITKQFTAVGILMLEEEGKLSVNDPVTKWIENYPTHGYTITLHHLLTHISGIKSYTGLEKWTKVWRQDMKPMEMIDLFKNEPMDFAPGEKWSYNNSAYFMLGYIIEKASGMPYPDFVEKRIFQPLGLKNTYYGSMSRVIANRASGYQKNETFVNAEYLSLTQPYAAGSIMSTVDDLLAWNTAIHAGKLVKKETLAKAFVDPKLNNGKYTHYGYGWGLNDINGSLTYEHSGGIFGYLSNGIYLPKEDVYVIVLSNCNCNPPSEISTRMAAHVIGKPYPVTAASVKLDEAYLKSLVGVYDFEDESTRYITYKDGQLYSQRAGGSQFKILARDKFNFFFEIGFTELQFVADKTGIKDVLFKDRRDVIKGRKTDKPVPVRIETVVPEDLLNTYAGVYEIQPGFNLTMTVEGGHLMSQATGQQKFELFAESPTKFFLKVVDAQVEFIKDAEGKVNSLFLYQNGRKIEGKRK